LTAEGGVGERVQSMTDEACIRNLRESAMFAGSPDRERTYLAEIAPEKIRLSLPYAARATVWSDLLVILATLRQLYWSAAGTQLTAPPGRADPAVDSRSTPRSDRGRSAASAATIPRTNQNCWR